MPRAAMRDPGSGLMVPILGGVDETQADAMFAPRTNTVIIGTLTAPHPTADTHIATKGYVDHLFPVGTIAATCGASVPVGWLLCNGQTVSRALYPDLFAALSTRFGAGDGTTFGLPDLRDRIPTCYYSGEASYDTINDAGGATDVTITASTFPAASGQFNLHGGGSRTSLHGTSGAMAQHSGVAAYGNPQYPQTGASSCGQYTISYGGSGGSHPNVQPSLALHFGIKY